MHLPADAVAAVACDDAELAAVALLGGRVPVSIACETSVSRLPGTIAAIPASIDSLVACDSASSAGMSAPDPEGDRRIAVPAVDDRAAVDGHQVAGGEGFVGRGMPCTTRSFTDEQMLAGKPW